MFIELSRHSWAGITFEGFFQVLWQKVSYTINCLARRHMAVVFGKCDSADTVGATIRLWELTDLHVFPKQLTAPSAHHHEFMECINDRHATLLGHRNEIE